VKEFKVENHESSLLPEGKEWTLAWSDEFDGTELDTSKWGFRLNFWGLRFDAYTDQGVSLDGNSNVVFRPVFEDGKLRSAQLQTGALTYDQLDFDAIQRRLAQSVGDNPWGEVELWPFKPLIQPKFMHKYGYYEARVKFQKRPFWWSAFWIQSPNTGSTCDPATSGVECDIIENFVNGTLTSGGIYGGYGKDFHDDSARIRYPYTEDDQFHRVGMEWSPEGYVYYFDGKEITRSSAPVSHTEQFVLLSTEIKGYRKGITPEYTEEDLNDCFIADYVRVFDAQNTEETTK